jgi:hypothetical protein
MSPRSLLLNGIALVGIVAWTAGAPRLVFGSDAGATIQPTPPAPEMGRVPAPTTPTWRVMKVNRDGARLVYILPNRAGDVSSDPDAAVTFGCAYQQGVDDVPYYVVETQVYDRKTRRAIKDRVTTRRVPAPIDRANYGEVAEKAFAERQYGEWDDGQPLTQAESRSIRR